MRANTEAFLARKRDDSPTPILVAIASSLVRSTGPGMPISTESPMPRSRIRSIQRRITLASKHRLLTT